MAGTQRFDTTCPCGYPITVRIFDGTKVAYFKRPGQPGAGRSITQCPSCRGDFPRLSAAEFKAQFFRVP
jgi:hypothetical protein